MGPGRRTLAALLLAAGCGGPAAGEPPPSGPPLDGYHPCGTVEKVGDFRVELAASFTAVSGAIAAAVVPGDRRELVAEGGGCRLLRRRLLVCNPGCAAGQTCGDGGLCLPYPENLGAGRVRLGGLARPVAMRPDPASKRYFATGLPHPGFVPGADIQLRADGAELPAFALAGRGVTPLRLLDRVLALQPGEPFSVAWEPGADGSVRIELTVSIDQHGLQPATLVCLAADSGQLEIPTDLITQLIAAGASGYPQAHLSRQSVDSTALPPGCVELVVASAVDRSVTVAGHTPCRADGDCASGQRCDTAWQSCR